MLSLKFHIQAACQKQCCTILAIPACFCTVQELRENSFKICLKRQRQTEFKFKIPPIWHCMHTPPHEESCCVTHAGVKTQWRGGRMTSQHPAEEQVHWSWTPFKHAHKGTYTRTYICVNTLLLCHRLSVVSASPATRALKHTHFLTRNNTGCPEETLELLCV